MEHDFQYVTKAEARESRDELETIIHRVQYEVREKFTFSFWYIGSSSRNMITFDSKTNVGYDFDINVDVNDEGEEYSAEEIRRIFRKALDAVARQYGYDYCEDSTRVLTVKKKDYWRSRIICSFDIAIVYRCDDGRQQFIRYNKNQGSYTWAYQPQPDAVLRKKEVWLKKHGCWQEVKDHYIDKKNNNTDLDKHSRSLYAETISDVCNWHRYRQ